MRSITHSIFTFKLGLLFPRALLASSRTVFRKSPGDLCSSYGFQVSETAIPTRLLVVPTLSILTDTDWLGKANNAELKEKGALKNGQGYDNQIFALTRKLTKASKGQSYIPITYPITSLFSLFENVQPF